MSSGLMREIGVYWPVALAFAGAALGSVLAGWRGAKAGWLGAMAGPAAIAAGWAALDPAVWRWIAPRSALDALVVPAVALTVGAGMRARFGWRWAAWAAVWFSAWWMAGSPAGRSEFWRVGFAVVAGAWLLRLAGAGTVRGSAVVGSTVAGGLLVAGGGSGRGSGGVAAALMVWVVVAAAAGLALGSHAGVKGTARRDSRTGPSPLATVGTSTLALAIVGAVLGSLDGHVMRGRVWTAEIACALALVAPTLETRLEASLLRRLGKRRKRWIGTVAAVLSVGGVALVLMGVLMGVALCL